MTHPTSEGKYVTQKSSVRSLNDNVTPKQTRSKANTETKTLIQNLVWIFRCENNLIGAGGWIFAPLEKRLSFMLS